MSGGSALSADHCARVCAGKENYTKGRIRLQVDALFFQKGACNLSKDEQVLSERFRSVALGAEIASAALTRSCSSNQEVIPSEREALVKGGSKAFVAKALAYAGLSGAPECYSRVAANEEIRSGDVLEFGNQAVILNQVGIDPFGIKRRLEDRLLPEKIFREKSIEKVLKASRSLCHDWMSDTTRFQISGTYLSVTDRSRAQVLHGSWDQLFGGDQADNFLNARMILRAERTCVNEILGYLHFKQHGPQNQDSAFHFLRYKTQSPSCRVSLEKSNDLPGVDCGRCCMEQRAGVSE
jgi:hypothetical protein